MTLAKRPTRLRITKRRAKFAAVALLFCAIAVLVLLQTQVSEAAALKSTSSICFECHKEAKSMTAKSRLHSPVKKGECTACHNPHASRHSLLLGDETVRLCYRCHEQKKGFEGEVVHEPVEDGDCLACHDPHSADRGALLKKSWSATCYTCHKKDELAKGENQHPNFRDGKCYVCHQPHASNRDGLLVRDRKSICTNCHKPNSAVLKKVHYGYDIAGSDCLDCHTPHSSDNKGLVSDNLHKPFADNECESCHTRGTNRVASNGIELCTSCHDTTLDSFNKIYNHLAVGNDENFCVSCHTPHASDEPALIKGKQGRVCFVCHVNTKEYVEKSKFVHNDDISNCAQCHVAHGSNEEYFLSSGDETCSTEQCHPEQGAFTHPVGPTVIDPRSKVAMNCATCHNPMGSPEEFILYFDREMELCVQCHKMMK